MSAREPGVGEVGAVGLMSLGSAFGALLLASDAGLGWGLVVVGPAAGVVPWVAFWWHYRGERA